MKCAIIGATGAVGREMMEDLEEALPRLPPLSEIGLFASARSAGEMMTFQGASKEVQVFSLEKVAGYDFALMSAGSQFSKNYAKSLAEKGVIVIDNSSAWRMDPDCPLVVPEVNGDLLDTIRASKKNKSTQGKIIANPNCSTIQLVVPLKSLKDRFGITTVHVATYQSVSGAGQKGISELGEQVAAQMRFEEPQPKAFAHPIAFNVIPAIDVLNDEGHCGEEEKIVRETKRILGMPNLDVLASTARVPVFNCHCEAVFVQLAQDVSRQQAMAAFNDAEGVEFIPEDDYLAFSTPRSVAGQQKVFVSRLRLPIHQKTSRWLQFWIVADNLKKGAATNAVQILERIASA